MTLVSAILLKVVAEVSMESHMRILHFFDFRSTERRHVYRHTITLFWQSLYVLPEVGVTLVRIEVAIGEAVFLKSAFGIGVFGMDHGQPSLPIRQLDGYR